MLFSDRDEAGRRLAEKLTGLRGQDVVVGLPRGGVPVAVEVANALAADVDVIVVRKLGVPYQRELAFGAVGEDGVMVFNRDVVELAGLTEQQIAEVVTRERAEVARRAERFRGRPARVLLAGRTVVIVDDGIATGATARAARTPTATAALVPRPAHSSNRAVQGARWRRACRLARSRGVAGPSKSDRKSGRSPLNTGRWSLPAGPGSDLWLRPQWNLQMGVAEMAHSRRAALVLDCGHLAPPRGRIESAAPLVGSYTRCPTCETFHEVVDVGRHLHAVPSEPGSRAPAAMPAATGSRPSARPQLRLVPSRQRRTAGR